jgi:Xaa-Pro aminopeptidase
LIPEEKYYVILLKTRLKLSSNIIADTKHMHNILAESRVYKTDEELEVMRWASIITCEAHCETMRNCKPGLREC